MKMVRTGRKCGKNGARDEEIGGEALEGNGGRKEKAMMDILAMEGIRAKQMSRVGGRTRNSWR